MGIDHGIDGQVAIGVDDLDKTEIKSLKKWIKDKKSENQFNWNVVSNPHEFCFTIESCPGELEVSLQQLKDLFVECDKYENPIAYGQTVVSYTITSSGDSECGGIYIDPGEREIRIVGYTQSGDLVAKSIRW